MKRNRFLVIIIISILVITSISLLFIFKDKVKLMQETFTPSPGSIPVSLNKQVSVSSTSPTNVYTCKYDECFVKGNVDVNSNSETQRVFFRAATGFCWGSGCTPPQKVYADTDGLGLKEWSYVTSGTRIPDLLLGIRTPEGYSMSIINGNLYIWRYPSGSAQYVRYNNPTPNCGTLCDPLPKYGACPNAQEVCNSAPLYSVSYKFCPNNDPNNVWCTKTESKTEPFTGGVNMNEAKLNYNDYIQFTPVDGANSPLPDASFTVNEYDQTCYKNQVSNPPTTCDKTQTKVYCKPQQQLVCSTGYSLIDRSSISRCYYGRDVPYNGKICTKDGESWITCETPLLMTDYSSYLPCNTQRQFPSISGALRTCDTFGSSLSCTQQNVNFKCYTTDSTGKLTLGEGWGGCSCSVSACAYGSLIINPDDASSFFYCDKDASGCTQKVPKSCNDPRLIFNSNAKNLAEACIVNPNLVCSSGSYKCIDLTHSKQCVPVSITNPYSTTSVISGFVWSDATINCGEQHCSDSESQGRCSCLIDNLNRCTSGNKICNTDGLGYKTCSDNGAGTCLDYRDKGEKCLSSETCSITTPSTFPCTTKSDCQYATNPPNNDVICDPIGKVNWICKTTAEYCNNTITKRCNPTNGVPQVCTLQTSNCYKWIDQTACTAGNQCSNGVCSQYGCSGAITQGYECDKTTKDLNNILVEECKNNQCVCINDSNTCQPSESGNKKCSLDKSKILTCSKVTTLSNTNKLPQDCYRWQLSGQIDVCSGDTPICKDN